MAKGNVLGLVIATYSLMTILTSSAKAAITPDILIVTVQAQGKLNRSTMLKPIKGNSVSYRQVYRALRPFQTKFPMVLPNYCTRTRTPRATVTSDGGIRKYENSMRRKRHVS